MIKLKPVTAECFSGKIDIIFDIIFGTGGRQNPHSKG